MPKLETQLEDEVDSLFDFRADPVDILEHTLDSIGLAKILCNIIHGRYTERKLYEDLIDLTLAIELDLERKEKDEYGE